MVSVSKSLLIHTETLSLLNKGCTTGSKDLRAGSYEHYRKGAEEFMIKHDGELNEAHIPTSRGTGCKGTALNLDVRLVCSRLRHPHLSFCPTSIPPDPAKKPSEHEGARWFLLEVGLE